MAYGEQQAEASAGDAPKPDAEPKLPFDPEEVIKDAKDYLEYCNRCYGANRTEGLDDLRFLAGEHWPETVRREREIDGRPCLTVNKLPTFLHQVTNDQRQNVPGIKVSPVGFGANDETAKILQGMCRHIEYDSNADIAYDTAVNSAAAIGEGYFRLVTDYCRPDSFDQEIRFERIRNAFTVYPDPTSQEPDGSDAKRGMISSRLTRTDFNREFPNAKVTSEGFTLGIGDPTNKDWLAQDMVRIAQFYRIEYTPAEAIQLSNGETGYADELVSMPPGVTVINRRPTFKPRTMLYKLTALEVIEHTEIKCKWIPLFPVYGDEIDLDGRVIRAGIIRNAKDPSKMYDFWMTSATEEVALRPKTPYIGAEGQFEGHEDEWDQANVRSFPYMEYKPVDLNGNLAPPPQRQAMADIPNGMLTMALHANDNVKATTGLFDSSLGARGNATSGRQEIAQQRQGDLANFHYTDNLNRTVRHVGRCIIDMIPHYYDTERVVKIMGEDDKISSATINQPVTEQQPNGFGLSVAKTLNDVTVGEYAVTVRAGPSYDTLRQEASASMVEFGKAWPKLMDVAGDKVVRAQDWPGADEIAERIAKTIPPELRDEEGEEGAEQAPMVQTPRGPIPLEQAGQMLQEMDQQIQEMGQALQEAQSGLDKARIDADAKIEVANINAVSRSDVEELKGVIQLLVAKMTPPSALVGEALTKGDGATPANGMAVSQEQPQEPQQGVMP